MRQRDDATGREAEPLRTCLARASAGFHIKGQYLRSADDGARYARWRRYAADGDGVAMRHLLRAHGLGPSAVRRPQDIVEEAWLDTVEALMTAARRAQRPPEDRLGDPPFGALLIPCIDIAMHRLCNEAGRTLAAISAQALDQAADVLLQRLSRLASPCLYAAFAATNPLTALSILGLPSSTEDSRYHDFVIDSLADGMEAIFRRFPVLARDLAIAVEQGIAALSELAARLYADEEVLAEVGARLPVTGLAATQSDPHGGGRVVMRVTFANGVRLAYKPRPVAMEALTGRLLRWAVESGFSDGLYAPAILDRGTHGWMEWVEPVPIPPGPDEEAQAVLFYRRAGALMALCNAFGGVDMHHENMIAAGAHPVLIDPEALLHPGPGALLEEMALPQHRMPPVLTAGFLPLYSFGNAGMAPINMGALGPSTASHGVEEPGFLFPNTDSMRLAEIAPPLPADHLPRIGDSLLDPCRYRAAICAGYRALWRIILQRRDWLLNDAASPLAGMEHLAGRYMIRNSFAYGRLQQRSREAGVMTAGIDRALCFEPLRRLPPDQLERLKPVLKAELTDLYRLDVPRFFHVLGTGDILDSMGQPTGLSLPDPVSVRLRRSLSEKTEADLDVDVAIIERALTHERPFANAATPVGQARGAVTARDLLRCHADHLAKTAIHRPEGGPIWLGLGGDTLLYGQPLGPGLYDGTAGLALVLAASARLLGEARHADLARAALRPAAELPETVWLALGGGFGQGLGGILASHVWVARLLDDSGLLQAALSLASHTARAASQERMPDLLGGSAGLILGLLLLHDATGDSQPRDAAVALGDRLLKRAQKSGAGIAWPVGQTPGLSGLSHGATGYALAFARLYRVSGDPVWLDAVHAALAHERSLFVPEAGNWLDLRPAPGRPAGEQRFMVSWCHGAPGIALGRAGLLQLLDGIDSRTGDEWREEGRTALATTAHHAADGHDDLCCGSAGRHAILQRAGTALGLPDCVTLASKGIEAKIARAADGNVPLWHSGHDIPLGTPGLFKGSAGLAYLLAGALEPQTVPDVLLPVF